MATLPALGGGRGVEEPWYIGGGEEARPAIMMYLFICLSFALSFSLGDVEKWRRRGTHHDGRMPHDLPDGDRKPVMFIKPSCCHDPLGVHAGGQI